MIINIKEFLAAFNEAGYTEWLDTDELLAIVRQYSRKAKALIEVYEERGQLAEWLYERQPDLMEQYYNIWKRERGLLTPNQIWASYLVDHERFIRSCFIEYSVDWSAIRYDFNVYLDGLVKSGRVAVEDGETAGQPAWMKEQINPFQKKYYD